MHDEPFGASELEVNIETLMEEVEKPPLGSTIDEEKTYVHATCRVAIFADTCPQEVLEVDKVVLQVTSRPKEY